MRIYKKKKILLQNNHYGGSNKIQPTMCMESYFFAADATQKITLRTLNVADNT